jgi:hypothetical protein
MGCLPRGDGSEGSRLGAGEMKREEKFGCRSCEFYVPPERAGIGGRPLIGHSGGRCNMAQRNLARLKSCPLAHRSHADLYGMRWDSRVKEWRETARRQEVLAKNESEAVLATPDSHRNTLECSNDITPRE